MLESLKAEAYEANVALPRHGLINLDGKQVEGSLRPSSDTPTHRRLFLAFPEIGGGAYEWETGNVIVELFSSLHLDPADYPAVLVNRHAPFTWGKTVAKAVEVAVATECIAHMALMSLQLEPKLPTIEPELLNKHFKRKHGPGAYYGQGNC